ncbi:hypothetical protein [Limosilactobacillus reuteri]|uniref:hypothetical protein n=2 Tax=Lactobacillaceae TaxID=33958 RepID=UPI003CA6379D
MMAEHFQLIQQYNQMSFPVMWQTFFEVYQMKSHFRVAIIYTPDSFIESITKKKFKKIEGKKRISRYAFSDNSFINLIQSLSDKKYKLKSIQWEKRAEESIDTIELSEITDLKSLKDNLDDIEDSLLLVDQAIQKITMQNSLRDRFIVTRYGEVIFFPASVHKTDSIHDFLEIIL